MTLVISVLSHHGLWQLTDHKLTPENKALLDPSLKHVYLEAEDGKALIAYAGVGKVGDTHISEWVRSVVRGKKRSLEQHLTIIQDASSRILVPITKRIGAPHTFSIAAYKGIRPTLYIISNRFRNRYGKMYVGDKFKIGGTNLGGKSHQVVVNFEGLGFLSITEIEAREMIVKIVRRRIKKPTIGQDVMAALSRLNASVANGPKSKKFVSLNCLVTYLARIIHGVS